MSRLTWYKIVKGEITVSLGAYLSAAHVVGLKLQAARSISVDTLSPAEALDVYERNWRHLDKSALVDEERELINGLKLVFSRAF